MNYYEELGLSRGATQEQIHRAYRTATLLLHPDRHTDPAVAKLAELQMQRLNDVYRTLAEPDRRWRYDHSLSGGSLSRQVGQAPRLESWIRQVCWYLGAALSVVAISWYISGERIRTSQIGPPPVQDVDPPSGAALAVNRHSLRPRAGANPKPGESDPERASAELPAPVPAAAENRAEPPAMWQQPSIEAQSPAETVAQPAERLEGTWFYVHPAGRTAAHSANFYSPEFIEAIITETGSRIRGRYSARYSIPDRAISPNVSFQFEGIVDDQEALLTWWGTGGSKGDAKITVVADNRIELRWSAAELGQQLGLSEGRAILVRASRR